MITLATSLLISSVILLSLPTMVKAIYIAHTDKVEGKGRLTGGFKPGCLSIS